MIGKFTLHFHRVDIPKFHGPQEHEVESPVSQKYNIEERLVIKIFAFYLRFRFGGERHGENTARS